MIVLVGFMGAGKTTIGRRLAARLGVPFLDSDLIIEQRQGRRIPEIFEQDGEQVFRDLEEQTVARLLGHQDGVLSLGGGSVERQTTRDALAGHTVIHLDVTFETAMSRVGNPSSRPMLRRGAQTLYERRAGTYRSVATVIVRADARSIDQIVNDLISRLTPSRLPADSDSGAEDIVVRSDGRQYPILVGSGVLDMLGETLPGAREPGQAFIVCQAPEPGVTDGRVVASRVAAGLNGRTVHVLPSPTGPVTGRAGDLAGRLADLDARAGDLLLAVGDRGVCDTTGVLSALSPGLRLVYVPTTLDAQADSTAGGFHEDDGDTRSVRASYRPTAVVCDLSVSIWAPQDEGWQDGLAELAKQAFVLGPGMLDPFMGRLPRLLNRDMIAIARTLRRGHNLKAALNPGSASWRSERSLAYGRPFAEALVRTHGPRPGSLSLGMLTAAHLAQRLGLLEEAAVDFHRSTLQALDLPVRCPGLDPQAAADALRQAGPGTGSGTLVLLEAVGRPVLDVRAEPHDLVAAFTRLLG